MTLETTHITVIKEISAVTIIGKLYFGALDNDDKSGWIVDDSAKKHDLEAWLEKFDMQFVTVTIKKQFPHDEADLLEGEAQ